MLVSMMQLLKNETKRRNRPNYFGTVPNVGLMAQKAEEYGSHDKISKFLEKER